MPWWANRVSNKANRPVRVTVGLLVLACAAMVGGAYLIAVWTVGLMVLLWGAGLAVFAVFRDDGQPQAGDRPFLSEARERWRRSA